MKLTLVWSLKGLPLNSVGHNEKGVALVVTLAIVAILLTAALQLGTYTGDSVMATYLTKDRFSADQLALSGINFAKLVLIEDAAKSEIDSVQEAWADPEKLSVAASELTSESDLLTIKITDELSKIQVNALIRNHPGNQLSVEQNRIWENLLRLKATTDNQYGSEDPAAIINSVKDWLDSGDDDAISGISGAESGYYLDLDHPYECANGPFNHIDELLNVKGISNDLFSTGYADQAENNNNDKVEDIELGDVFTIYGLEDEHQDDGGYKYSGKININTAPVDVLAGILPEGLDEYAQDLVDYRNAKAETGDDFLNQLSKGWYKSVIDLSEKEQKRLEGLVTYSSHTFKIECTARKKGVTSTLAAFLKREKNPESGKWQCRILQMERK